MLSRPSDRLWMGFMCGYNNYVLNTVKNPTTMSRYVNHPSDYCKGVKYVPHYVPLDLKPYETDTAVVDNTKWVHVSDQSRVPYIYSITFNTDIDNEYDIHHISIAIHGDISGPAFSRMLHLKLYHPDNWLVEEPDMELVSEIYMPYNSRVESNYGAHRKNMDIRYGRAFYTIIANDKTYGFCVALYNLIKASKIYYITFDFIR